MSRPSEQLIRKQDLIHLAILITIALGIGIYLIATTVMIARDGVFYIERAQQFAADPLKVIKVYHPGYPFLIFVAHKLVSLGGNISSVYSWIYCAQGVSLLCRVLSLIPLYFIGKLLVGPRRGFWALVILTMLPYPAAFASDVVREWPHILFVSLGLLLLIGGSRFGKLWMFGVAGLAAGIAHTIRPEGAQIVIYGILWLLINLFRARPNMGRLKAVCAATVLLLGFAIIAAPYMKVRGRVLPPKLKTLVGCAAPQHSDGIQASAFDDNAGPYTASALPGDILRALARLGREVIDNLMYFFVLPLAIGLYCHFRRLRKILLTERFFMFALMVLYLAIMVLLSINYDYISRRHCMPMVVFTAFYIPVGLQILARWLSMRFCKNTPAVHEYRQRWFFVLIAIGLGICVIKLTRITPLRQDKQGYVKAAVWLKENTGPEDVIAVPDKRIAFYAGRRGLTYGKNIPKQAKYVVRVVKGDDEEPKFARPVQETHSVWADRREKKRRIVVYRVL